VRAVQGGSVAKGCREAAISERQVHRCPHQPSPGLNSPMWYDPVREQPVLRLRPLVCSLLILVRPDPILGPATGHTSMRSALL
jgi:hypothetical protein